MTKRTLAILAVVSLGLAACVDGTTPDCSKVSCGPDLDGAVEAATQGDAASDAAADAASDAHADAASDAPADAPSDAPNKG